MNEKTDRLHKYCIPADFVPEDADSIKLSIGLSGIGGELKIDKEANAVLIEELLPPRKKEIAVYVQKLNTGGELQASLGMTYFDKVYLYHLVTALERHGCKKMDEGSK